MGKISLVAKSPSVNSQQQQTHIYARSGNFSPLFNGRPAALCDQKERCPRTHVAVQYSPPLAAHTACLAGDDGRHVDQRLLWQECARLCGVVQMVGWVVDVADGVWHSLSMVLQWRSRVDLHWFLWRRPPSFYCGWWVSFFCLVDQPSRCQRMTRQWHSAAGMYWRHDKLDRDVRRPV